MTGRAPFFDQTRALLVCGVALLHAACGYSRLVPWWHVQGPPSALADVLVAVLDVFLMPLLFFIAGVFAPASAARTTAAGFVVKKARRLLWPLCLLTLFYLPAMAWWGARERLGETLGFFTYWQRSLATLGDGRPVLLATVAEGEAAQGALSPHLLWFLSLLFLFFLGYRFLPGVRGLAARLRLRPRVLAVAGLAMAVAVTSVNAAIPAGAWWQWNAVLLFQPVRLPLYAGFFLLGACLGACDDTLPALARGRAWPLCVTGAVAVAATVALAGRAHAPGGAPLTVLALHAGCRTAANLLLVCACLRLGLRRQRPLPAWGASLAASSYDIYLLHMPLVVFAQYALAGLGWGSAAKLALSAAAAVAGCWLASAALVRPHPRAAVAALLLFFAGFCLFGG
jgi:peptidoglycan/LPS O-acetylase OafA/YrhL